MRLKRIEIEGFKSFAERTVIELPERGLCAVVGPNGCGKSNLVDALRWVLGEQSAKALRARSMEEVIFAGSKDRRPAGAAEVTIVFDNAQGLAPEPFTSAAEISITRRLLRSGESEYLINRSPCRLKDIRQLVMDTGLGNRAYAIIEQGRVAGFVEAKASERRLWIEEAAGITRYKDQRSASLRRMEATRANLARVEDILSEVQAQMNSLQRQAAKARRHQQLTSRIRELRLKIGSWQWHRLTQEIEELSREVAAAQAELTAGEGHEQALATRLEATRTALAEAAQVIDAHAQARLELEGRIQRTENAHTLAGQQARTLMAQAERLGKELAGLREEKHSLEGQLAAAERRAVAAQRREQELNHRCHQLEQNLDDALQTLHSLEQKLEFAREEVVELLGRRTQAEGRLEETRLALNTLEHRIKRMVERGEELRGFIAQARQELQTLQQQHEKANQQLNHATAAVHKAQQNLELSEARLEKAGSAEAELSRYLHEIAARQEGLRAAVSEAKWAGDGARRVLEAAREGRFKVLGLVGQLLRAAPGKESVVAAALGEWVEGVVVANQAQAELLLKWASEKGLNVRVVILEALENHPTSPPPDTEPVARWVGVQEGFRPLTRLLEPAGFHPKPLQWLGKLGPGQVVMDGAVVVENWGARLGATAGATAALTQINELRELEEKLHSGRERLAQAKAERQRLESAVAAAKAELSSARDEEAKAQARIRDIQEALAQAEARLASAQNQHNTLKLELEELEQQRQELRLRSQKLEAELEELSTSLPEAEASMARLKDQLAEAGELLQDLRAQETELKVALAEAHSEATRQTKRQRRLVEELSRARKRELELLQARDQALKQAEALGARRKELEKQLARMYEELKTQQEAYSQALESRRELEQKLGELEKELQQARAARMEASAYLQEAKLKLEHRNEQLEHLLEVYRDELRVELAEYARLNPPDRKFEPEQAGRELERLRKRLMRLGPVNMTALEEYEAVAERHRFLSEQKADLEASLADLAKAMRRINRASRKRFTQTLEELNAKLHQVFPVLFGGGKAELVLEEGADPLEAGVELMVQLPGKKVKHLEALSGGEKVMAAVAVLMALFLVRPAPVCVLDEVDAALDEVNTGRFIGLLKDLSQRCQLITITHNRRTMEVMDVLYGVTMQEAGVSRVVMVTLEEGKALAAA